MTLSLWSLSGSSTLSLGTNQTTTNVPIPSGSNAGDLAIVTQYQEVDTYVAVTSTDGFTVLTRGENATSDQDVQYTTWYKVLNGSEGGGTGNYRFTHASIPFRAAVCAVYTPPGTPTLGAQSSAVQTGNATTLALTAITTTGANALVLAAQCNYNEDNQTAITSPFAKDVEMVGGSGGGISLNSNEQAATGTTGTITITIQANTNSVGAMHSFNPTAVAAKAKPIYQRRSYYWPSRRR